MSELGRNDPCPCGSGKKYKLCCIGKRIKKAADGHAEVAGGAGIVFWVLLFLIVGTPIALLIGGGGDSADETGVVEMRAGQSYDLELEYSRRDAKFVGGLRLDCQPPVADDMFERAVDAAAASDAAILFVGLNDVAAASLNEETLSDVRSRVLAELAAIAAWPDGAPELVEFNRRVRNRIVETRRELSKLVNSPPRFGFRGTGSSWMRHLEQR